MEKNYTKTIWMMSPGTYSFTAFDSVFPDIMEIKNFFYVIQSNPPTSLTIYATIEESADEFVEENIIGTVSLSESSAAGSITIVNKGKALSGKSYFAIVMNESKRAHIDFSFTCDLASTTKIYNGSSWDECAVKIHNGTSFVPGQIYRYDGSQWLECTLHESDNDT